MKNQKAINNFLIVISYFLVYLLLTWNISGGDIFLWFIFIITLLIHLIIVAVIFFKKPKSLLNCFGGIVMAVIVCFSIIKFIEHGKAQTKPTIETSQNENSRF